MGIIDRLTRIARANINNLLDEAENPESMLEQILRDMQQGISETKQQIAGMIAQEKELAADAAENRSLASSLEGYAERAVVAGQLELAREALRRQKDYEANAAVYEQQATAQHAVVDRMKTQLASLDAKFKSTLTHRDALLARHKAASAEASVMNSAQIQSLYDPISDLNRIERRIRMAESRNEATREVGEDDFMRQISELEGDDEIEARLQRIIAAQASEQPKAIAK